jgi:hypothetical protein
MSVKMQQLQLKLNDEAFKDVVFLSHTVDPEIRYACGARTNYAEEAWSR